MVAGLGMCLPLLYADWMAVADVLLLLLLLHFAGTAPLAS
jgi:hypothetical protein